MKPEIQINPDALFAAMHKHTHRDPLSSSELNDVVEIVNNCFHTMNKTSQDFGGLKRKITSCAYGGLLGTCAIDAYKEVIEGEPGINKEAHQLLFTECLAMTISRALEGVAIAMIEEGI